MKQGLTKPQEENLVYIDVPIIINLLFCFNGILNTYSDQMISLLEKLVENKFIVHILSNLSKEKTEEELNSLGYISDIHYHYLLSILDHNNSLPEKLKGHYCKITHCEYFFDNSIKSKKYIPKMTNFLFVETENDFQKMKKILNTIIENK